MSIRNWTDLNSDPRLPSSSAAAEQQGWHSSSSQYSLVLFKRQQWGTNCSYTAFVSLKTVLDYIIANNPKQLPKLSCLTVLPKTVVILFFNPFKKTIWIKELWVKSDSISHSTKRNMRTCYSSPQIPIWGDEASLETLPILKAAFSKPRMGDWTEKGGILMQCLMHLAHTAS